MVIVFKVVRRWFACRIWVAKIHPFCMGFLSVQIWFLGSAPMTLEVFSTIVQVIPRTFQIQLWKSSIWSNSQKLSFWLLFLWLDHRIELRTILKFPFLFLFFLNDPNMTPFLLDIDTFLRNSLRFKQQVPNRLTFLILILISLSIDIIAICTLIIILTIFFLIPLDSKRLVDAKGGFFDYSCNRFQYFFVLDIMFLITSNDMSDVGYINLDISWHDLYGSKMIDFW